MTSRAVARRTIVFGAAGLAASSHLLARSARAQSGNPAGHVLKPNEGEHLIQRGGNIFIKADPSRGSKGLAMGTQQILVGIGIPVHRHFEMDEAFYVVEGGGTFLLQDARHPIEKGDSIFIPKNAWHGFKIQIANCSCSGSLRPGLEAFFREVAALPGATPVTRTKEQLNEIARRHGTEFR